MKLEELFRKEYEGKTIIFFGNGSEELMRFGQHILLCSHPFHSFVKNKIVEFQLGRSVNELYGLEESEFHKLNSFEEKKYWSKASDFPQICWIWLKHWKACAIVTSINSHNNKIQAGNYNPFPFGALKEARWSDRPFDRYADGKKTLIEKGGAQ